METSATLEHKIAELGIEAPAGAARDLVRFLELVRKWNKVYNLTKILGDERMVIEHVLDSLSVLPLLQPSNVIDVGTGAGFPGIPIAIMKPAWHLTLLDSSHKRCAFLRQAIIDLELPNVDIACARVEQFLPATLCDTALCRAFAETADFASMAVRLVHDNGIMVAMKGLYPADELERLPGNISVRDVVRLKVPGLDAQRHAVIMTKALI